MDKKITFSDQNQTCKNVGILRVLFDQILHENTIDVVKGRYLWTFLQKSVSFVMLLLQVWKEKHVSLSSPDY